MKRSNAWCVALGALMALCLAAPVAAAARDDDKTVNEKILDILLEKGDISPQRYEELREEALAEKEAASLPQVASSPLSGWKVYWNNGTRIEREDGKVKVKFGGRVHYDTAASSVTRGLQRMFPGSEGTGNDFRRARLFMSGAFGDHGIFKVQYDFSGQDADFRDVYAGLQKIPYLGTVRVGSFYEPQSIEMTTSSKYITFLERSLPVLAFTAERNSGIGFHNQLHDGRMTFHAGVFRNVDDSGEDFDNQGGYNAGFRITGVPVFRDEGEKVVHTGFWYSHQFRDNEMLRYDPDAESNTVGSLLNMPMIKIDGIDLIGGELAVICGPFFFQGETIHSFVNGSGSNSSNRWFYGTSVQAGAFLTGERKKYDQKLGVIGRTKVLEPFSLEKGQWGALEVAGRWSMLSLNDGSVRGGNLNNYTLGLNWYLYSNLRLMLNYVLAHRNGVGQAHIAQSRVSLDF